MKDLDHNCIGTGGNCGRRKHDTAGERRFGACVRCDMCNKECINYYYHIQSGYDICCNCAKLQQQKIYERKKNVIQKTIKERQKKRQKKARN